MTQLQDAQKGAEVTSEATERELELEAQLVEARSIIQEQVCEFHNLCTVSELVLSMIVIVTCLWLTLINLLIVYGWTANNLVLRNLTYKN